jgi:hypothetical protein
MYHFFGHLSNSNKPTLKKFVEEANNSLGCNYVYMVTFNLVQQRRIGKLLYNTISIPHIPYAKVVITQAHENKSSTMELCLATIYDIVMCIVIGIPFFFSNFPHNYHLTSSNIKLVDTFCI